MKFFTEVNTFYPFPSFKFTFDFSLNEKNRLSYLDVEVVWLKWGISFSLISEE